MRVDVTSEDIEQAKSLLIPDSSQDVSGCCPIALALKRMGYTDPKVYTVDMGGGFFPERGDRSRAFSLPEDAARFAVYFEWGEHWRESLVPITFEGTAH